MSQLVRTVTGQSQKSRRSIETTNSKASASLSRTGTNDPYAGFLNHLSPAQEQRLQEFKSRLRKTGLWLPDGINGKPSHDDATLLRFLRARKFEIEGAIKQFSDTENWYKEHKIEELYEHFDVDFYEHARRMYPQWTGRRDYRGIPVYVYEIKGLDSKNVSKYQKLSEEYKKKLPHHKDLQTPAKLLPLFALYNNLLKFILPMCSALDRPNPEVAVTNSCNIVDISGVGLTQFWNLKQHMQDASVLATAHYPETLDRIFILGAPAFFPTVWGWIKRWFDPVTVSKIFILSKNEVKPTLSKYMSMKDVPKKYGGELDWDWGDLPSLGSAEKKAMEKDGHTGYVKGPALWLNDKRILVGTENGSLRFDEKEANSLKPAIYRADYSENPVHAEKVGKMPRNTEANGDAIQHPSTPNKHALAAAQLAHHRSVPSTPAATDTPAPVYPTPANRSPSIVTDAPKSTAVVDMKPSQPADVRPTPLQPQQTPKVSPSPPDVPQPTQATIPTSTLTTPASPVPAPVLSPHPPAQPVPGPLDQHAVEMNKAIASKMEGESIAVIPPTSGQNGDIAHPEVVVASDMSLGLAAEAEKLHLGDAANVTGRPSLDRFVTAQDVKAS